MSKEEKTANEFMIKVLHEDRVKWKKIAEKLAETLTYLPINENQDYFEIKEDVLDWARKEVEKDD